MGAAFVLAPTDVELAFVLVVSVLLAGDHTALLIGAAALVLLPIEKTLVAGQDLEAATLVFLAAPRDVAVAGNHLSGVLSPRIPRTADRQITFLSARGRCLAAADDRVGWHMAAGVHPGQHGLVVDQRPAEQLQVQVIGLALDLLLGHLHLYIGFRARQQRHAPVLGDGPGFLFTGHLGDGAVVGCGEGPGGLHHRPVRREGERGPDLPSVRRGEAGGVGEGSGDRAAAHRGLGVVAVDREPRRNRLRDDRDLLGIGAEDQVSRDDRTGELQAGYLRGGRDLLAKGGRRLQIGQQPLLGGGHVSRLARRPRHKKNSEGQTGQQEVKSAPHRFPL